MSKKWFIVPIVLLTLWGGYSISSNIVKHSAYYAQHLPHQKGTNPELIFALKHLYYLKKPKDTELRYDYDGTNTIIVNDEYFIDSHIEPEIFLSRSDSNYISYSFNDQGKFLTKQVQNSTTRKTKYSKSIESKKEAEAYVERAVRPILEVQPKPKVNLQWLFNLIYQRQFN